MEIAETIKKIIQELIVPELETIKAENNEIKTTLELTNKRLDDLNGHLIDQSRRIDEINKRIDELNKRIDRLYEVIVRRDEHEKLELRIMRLEQELTELKTRAARV